MVNGQCPGGHVDCSGRGGRVEGESDSSPSSGPSPTIIGLAAALGAVGLIAIFLIAFIVIKSRRAGRETV